MLARIAAFVLIAVCCLAWFLNTSLQTRYVATARIGYEIPSSVNGVPLPVKDRELSRFLKASEDVAISDFEFSALVKSSAIAREFTAKHAPSIAPIEDWCSNMNIKDDCGWTEVANLLTKRVITVSLDVRTSHITLLASWRDADTAEKIVSTYVEIARTFLSAKYRDAATSRYMLLLELSEVTASNSIKSALAQLLSEQNRKLLILGMNKDAPFTVLETATADGKANDKSQHFLFVGFLLSMVIFAMLLALPCGEGKFNR